MDVEVAFVGDVELLIHEVRGSRVILGGDIAQHVTSSQLLAGPRSLHQRRDWTWVRFRQEPNAILSAPTYERLVRPSK